MIGDLEKSSFSNIEQQSLEFVKYTLDPWVCRWEQSMQRALLTQDEKKEYFFKFNVDGLLRGDYQSRMNGYATGRQKTEKLSLTVSPLPSGLVKVKTGTNTSEETYNNWYTKVYEPQDKTTTTTAASTSTSTSTTATTSSKTSSQTA